MSEVIKHKTKKYIVIVFTFLMGMVVFNDVTNKHVHQLANGKMVIHAHPFNKKQDSAPIKNHHHTTCDFIQIQSISNLFLSLVEKIDLTALNTNTVVYLFYYIDCNKGFIHTYNNKAPPLSI